MASKIDISYNTLTGKQYDDMDDDNIIDDLRPYLLQFNPSRGDVFHIIEAGTYRNSGMFMWDGTEPVALDYDTIEYGCVPNVFTIGDEFLANHWSHIIDYEDIVWVDVERYRDQLLNNMKDDVTYYDTDLGRFYLECNRQSVLDANRYIQATPHTQYYMVSY